MFGAEEGSQVQIGEDIVADVWDGNGFVAWRLGIGRAGIVSMFVGKTGIVIGWESRLRLEDDSINSERFYALPRRRHSHARWVGNLGILWRIGFAHSVASCSISFICTNKSP